MASGDAVVRVVDQHRGDARILEYQGRWFEQVSAVTLPRVQKEVETHQLRQQIAALAGERSEECERLLTRLDVASAIPWTDDMDRAWTAIGEFIVNYGQPALWTALFIRFSEEFAVGRQDGYTDGAEYRFLYGAHSDAVRRHVQGAAQSAEV